MSQFLIHAKTINTLAKNDFNNSDKVLAEIMQMQSVNKQLSSRVITSVIMTRLNLKETNVRKVMSELRSSGVIIKKNQIISINPKYLKQ